MRLFNVRLYLLMAPICLNGFVSFATASLLPPNFQAVSFNGYSAYLHLNWQPRSEHRVIAWFNHLAADPNHWHYLLSGDNVDLAFNHHSIRVKLGETEFTVRNRFAFVQTRQIAFHLRQGALTVSDGQTQHSVYDPTINPSVHYHYAMRKDRQYSFASLQSLGLIDYQNSENTHGYLFDPNKGVINTRTNVADHSQLFGVSAQDYQPIQPLPVAPKPLLADQAQWDQQFAKAYPEKRPLLDHTEGNDQQRFAWEGHYWLRAYLVMARTFNDDKYLDYAVELIDHMLAYTDQQRTHRGELDLKTQPYVSAPKWYLTHPTEPTPSWRRPFNGWRVALLSDGQIVNAIMQVVNHIKSANKEKYFDKAEQYLDHTLSVIHIHESSYSSNKNTAIEGSYFYVNSQNKHLGNAGLYSNPLPYNHNMTMGVALIYANKWSNIPRPDLQNKIDEILGFFTAHLRQQNGLCEWDYAFDVKGKTKIEDLNHAHLDIGFLVAAEQEGYLKDDSILRCIASTLAEQIYLPPVMLHYDVSGAGVSSSADHVAIGYDWLTLAKYDQRIQTIAQHVLHHYGQPHWFRPYLAWAELMALTSKLEQPDQQITGIKKGR